MMVRPRPTPVGLCLTLATLLVALVAAGLPACHGDTEVHAAYRCPMECEGDKRYPEPGSCPVCGMELVEVAQ